MNNIHDFPAYINDRAAQVEIYLEEALGSLRDVPDTLMEAMRYSLLSGGKRLRPVMTLESNRMAGGDIRLAVPFACALEMIHSYSLIHDDLPAMDDDDLRRGKPTSHIRFGEAMAILAGDALLNSAMETMAVACQAHPELTGAMVCVAKAAGAGGMIAGQVLDMSADGDVRQIHEKKTGALFHAAMRSGLMSANADDASLQAMDEYARQYGLLFQITDDILDAVGESAKLGKSTGKDARDEKSTYVTLYGVDEARAMAKQCRIACQDALSGLERAEFFMALAEYTAQRDR